MSYSCMSKLEMFCFAESIKAKMFSACEFNYLLSSYYVKSWYSMHKNTTSENVVSVRKGEG